MARIVGRVPVEEIRHVPELRLPGDITGEEITYIEGDDGSRSIIIPTQQGSTVLESFHDHSSVTRFSEEAGVAGSVQFSENPSGVNPIERAIMVCINFLLSDHSE